LTTSLKTYDEIIPYLIKKKRTPHLLLGNGFSMAYDHEIFSYNALFGFIEDLDDEFLSKLFGIVKTKNFELVMQQLDNFCELIEAFGSDNGLLEKVKVASANLKSSLIDAVESLHPEHVFKIPDEESARCARFLSDYLSNEGNIFSTNYDILLYWVLMRNNIQNHRDGFGRDREDDETDFSTDPEYSELRWGINKKNQNTHYLHGALPIFDAGIHIVKEEYSGSGYLLENIEARMATSEYPVFVASGNGDEKLNHILHNRYLTHCYETLCTIEGSLVTFGFNFGGYDHHIINAINIAAKQGKRVGNKLFSIYIGVYSEDDKKHIEKIKHLFKCKVNLFDAKTAKIWR
jgi:hypothetical protein